MALIVASSDVHAAGVFTTTPIRKGKRIVEYTGPRVTKEEGDRIYDEKPVTYLFALEDGRVIDGHGIAMFINHCCDPNCETDEVRGKIWVYALRNIQAGEELTYDYNLFDGDEDAPCSCGAKRCRGTLFSREEMRKRRRERKRD
ncbi:MAG TPA: SET domain-containing protein-lysine N-methyltransferase [Terriglobales bacterium]|nr:SET domain-containing protein-lysine N-methyltransferase [Terriglobales bacterium]